MPSASTTIKMDVQRKVRAKTAKEETGVLTEMTTPASRANIKTKINAARAKNARRVAIRIANPSQDAKNVKWSGIADCDISSNGVASTVVGYNECVGHKKDDVWELPIFHGSSNEVYEKLLVKPGPMFQGMLTSKVALGKNGFLDESIISFQEWDTSIRLSKIYIIAPIVMAVSARLNAGQ